MQQQTSVADHFRTVV